MTLRGPGGLHEDEVERRLRDPASRQALVTPMFDLIAPQYDRFTRVFSFGMDGRWKKALVAAASRGIAAQGIVCDVATGTGDLAFALAEARPDVFVAATDVSTNMLALALSRRNRTRAIRVALSAGDLSALPFPDASLNAVTAGYALRNTPDWNHSLRELARVIRPGGQLFTLDFYLPDSPVWRSMFLAWLSGAGRLVGWWWHREPMVYGYIAPSIRHFTTAHGFEAALALNGFDVRLVRRWLGGGIVLHDAVRRQAG